MLVGWHPTAPRPAAVLCCQTLTPGLPGCHVLASGGSGQARSQEAASEGTRKEQEQVLFLEAACHPCLRPRAHWVSTQGGPRQCPLRTHTAGHLISMTSAEFSPVACVWGPRSAQGPGLEVLLQFGGHLFGGLFPEPTLVPLKDLGAPNTFALGLSPPPPLL